jgi:SAM-dependent methyltransferase
MTDQRKIKGDRLALTLCRLGDSLCSAPLLKWILKTPALGNRSARGSFVEWEFQNAPSSWKCFNPYDCLGGKEVLDVGCGHGGKSAYYALQGARHVTAIDKDNARIEAAREFARKKNVINISFEAQDAATLPYSPEYFDLVIFSDSFEHLEEPAASLQAAYRTLRKGGTVNITFPPYGSPWGAHLFAHIRIPWGQFLFPEEMLVRLWKARFSASNEQGLVYSGDRTAGIQAATTIAELGCLNRMSIQRFEDIVAMTSFKVLFYNLRTIGNLFGSTARFPFLREHLVTRLVAVLGKAKVP